VEGKFCDVRRNQVRRTSACTVFSEALTAGRCTSHAVCLHFPHRHNHEEEERQMDQWHDFFLAQAGAAGVLTGLVFVGVSINLEKIVSEAGSGLPGRAAEALILLVAVLTASILLLVPGQGPVMVGAEVLTVGLAAWGWIVAIQLPLLRSWQTMRPDLRGPFVLRVAIAQIATIPAIVAGIAVLAGGLGGLYWLVAGMVFSILAALFEAWVLLIEINR
jgi:hypothetical protein